jgi:integrase
VRSGSASVLSRRCGATWVYAEPKRGLCAVDHRRGQALTYDSGQKIFVRLKEKTGIANLHAHRFRHTWAQVALRKGAERALVQDQLGWSSDQMVKRYSGFVRTRLAGDSMPKFAPI